MLLHPWNKSKILYKSGREALREKKKKTFEVKKSKWKNKVEISQKIWQEIMEQKTGEKKIR